MVSLEVMVISTLGNGFSKWSGDRIFAANHRGFVARRVKRGVCYDQAEALTLPVVVSRLINARRHLLALRIATLLGMGPEKAGTPYALLCDGTCHVTCHGGTLPPCDGLHLCHMTASYVDAVTWLKKISTNLVQYGPLLTASEADAREIRC